MFNFVIKTIAKKYAVNLVNDVIRSIDKKCDVDFYRQKILKVMRFLNNLMDYLEDKTIDGDEADKIIEETKELF